jgi:hypothetical protein
MTVLHSGNKTFVYIQVFSTLFLGQAPYEQAIGFYVPFFTVIYVRI